MPMDTRQDPGVRNLPAPLASKPSSIGLLPQELVEHILDALKSDIRSLKNCSLTCRRWLPRSSMHLFTTYSFWVIPTHLNLERKSAMLSIERIRANIVNLYGKVESLSDLALFHDLPCLRLLSITYRGEEGSSVLQSALSCPRPQPSRPRLDHLDIDFSSVGFVELVLRSFDEVGLLSVLGLTDESVDPIHLTRHVIRALQVMQVPSAVEQPFLSIIDPRTLESISWCPARSVTSMLPETVLHTIGSHVRTYIHADLAPSSIPLLHPYASLRSVIITTDALEQTADPLRWQQLLQSLEALPLSIVEVTLLYNTLLREQPLAKEMKIFDWPAIHHALRRHPGLVSLKIGGAFMKRGRWYPALRPIDAAGEADVLASLPADLRRIATYVHHLPEP